MSSLSYGVGVGKNFSLELRNQLSRLAVANCRSLLGRGCMVFVRSIRDWKLAIAVRIAIDTSQMTGNLQFPFRPW